MGKEQIELLCQGTVFYMVKDMDKMELPWQEHHEFRGVALKHLVRGEDTDGQFSAHLVRVLAGCEIGDHMHQGKWEMHEVIAGSGKCRLANKEVAYTVGSAAVLPPDVSHKVRADQDLYILAKFVPALV